MIFFSTSQIIRGRSGFPADARIGSTPRRFRVTRERALLFLGFVGAFRRSEIAALDVEESAFEPLLWACATPARRRRPRWTVAIYARVSSERQREEHTIASQTAALIEFAESRGFSVPKPRSEAAAHDVLRLEVQI